MKLTTRSPKDSYWALCKAKGRMQLPSGCALDAEDVDHNNLWVEFAEKLRFAQKVENGEDALMLLATSSRIFEDLNTDVFENPANKDQIQLAVRNFDDSITPVTEFRGFVWDKKFVCCGQYFYQLFFRCFEGQSSDDLLARISSDLRRFYESVLAPSMPNFSKHCPCFMMDLVWTNEGRVLLTEINPFDGEAVGVFPASTGLFSWDRDRPLMMGQVDFELRVRREPLITAQNLKKHPELRNLSPLWKEAIYGQAC